MSVGEKLRGGGGGTEHHHWDQGQSAAKRQRKLLSPDSSSFMDCSMAARMQSSRARMPAILLPSEMASSTTESRFRQAAL